MFDRVFGNYLLSSGVLTEEQLEATYELQESSRSRLGVIAVSESLMTIKQVEEVNNLQAVMDKRFGDIAISNGFLTDDQVTHLLKLQGSTYLVFLQSLLDKEYLSMEMVNSALKLYQTEHAYSQVDMDALKSCDIDRIIPYFVSVKNPLAIELVTTFVKTIARLLDYHVYLEPLYTAQTYHSKQLSYQIQDGEHRIFAGISGDESTMRSCAISFAGEKLVTDQEDALDAMCEFTNCVNGLFATKMSSQKIELDMYPPLFNATESVISGGSLFVLPIHVNGEKIDLVISIDADITVN